MVIAALSAPLIPFLHTEPSTLRVPLPVSISDELLFTFIAAPSNASATSVSVLSSLSGFSASVRVFVPSTLMVTLHSFFITIGADVEQVRERLFKMSVTSVTPLLTSTCPSLHEPVILYVPDAVIVRVVPSMEYPSPVVDVVIPLSENVNVLSAA